MKLISHRGNLIGKEIELENSPQFIEKALSFNFDVECDLWYLDNKFFLGHDKAQYSIDFSWLNKNKDKLWVHCKNLQCVSILNESNLNYFWHENDKMTITSKKIPWCKENVFIKHGVTVVFKKQEVPNYIFGVCSDEIKFFMQ